MLEKIKAYIKENRMLEQNDRVVIGISGGADSVCLFFVLLSLQKEYSLTLHAVHINHGIRGEEADADEAFVEELAKSQGAEFTCFRADIPGLAKEKGISEEEAGRNFRYEKLEEVREKTGADKIAVAHNENDCAETVLLNLFRGTGLLGLSGISPVRGRIIRPLLCVSRSEIEKWLMEKRQPYRTDRTNFCDDYTRNRIRLHFLTMAEREINEKAVEHTAQAAFLLREVSDYMEKKIKEAFLKNVSEENGAYSLKNSLLEEEPVIQKGVIKLALERLAGSKRDLESRHVEMVGQLFLRQTGKTVCLPYEMKAWRDYTGVLLQKEEKEGKKEEKAGEIDTVLVPGAYSLGNGERIVFEFLSLEEKFAEIPKNDCTKWFDYDKIKGSLSLRHRKNGDFIQIREDGGRKKLKDDLIDRKVPRQERDRLWLLADGSHVLWVLGGRTSEAYRITEETVRILKVSIDGGKQDGR